MFGRVNPVVKLAHTLLTCNQKTTRRRNRSGVTELKLEISVFHQHLAPRKVKIRGLTEKSANKRPPQGNRTKDLHWPVLPLNTEAQSRGRLLLERNE